MILDLYPDAEENRFHGYEYASGCQNLFSGNNSARESRLQTEEEEKKQAVSKTMGGDKVSKEAERREKQIQNWDELKKAQRDFLKKGDTVADSPRDMTHGTNTMNSTAAFLKT